MNLLANLFDCEALRNNADEVVGMSSCRGWAKIFFFWTIGCSGYLGFSFRSMRKGTAILLRYLFCCRRSIR